MKMHPMNSSNIDAIGYENETLHVRFHSGKTYSYEGVERPKFEAMLNATSPGSYFHAHIRSRYNATEVRR